jgi:hypothetical protein
MVGLNEQKGRAMSEQTQVDAKRALRVGILLEGRLLEERLFFRPQTVTIGRSARRADIVVPSEALAESATLFSRGGGQFWVNVADGVQARISAGADEPVRRVKASRVALGSDTRGKISFGEVTVLFQVVTRPKSTGRPRLPRALRGAWFGGLNPISLAAIALSAVLQIGFVTWLATQEWPEPLEAQMLVENEFARILRIQPPEEKDTPDPPQESTDQGSASADAEPAPSEPDSPDPPDSPSSDEPPASDPADPLRMAKKVEQETILGVIGTRNEDGESAIDEFLAASGEAELDAAIAGANKLRVGDASDRDKLASGRDDQTRGRTVGVGGLERSNGARQAGRDVDTGQKAEEEVDCHGCTVTQVPDEPSTRTAFSNPQTISDAIRRVQGRIQHCYERKVKMYPGLAGKVVVTFTIEQRGSRGRVTDARASVDQVGQGVGACVAGEIKRIRLPKPRGEQVVVNKAFIFEHGG